jgi:tRNA (cytidine/uridine-2'-O-)-methyltransferase
VDVHVWESWEELHAAAGEGACFKFVEVQGELTYWQADLHSEGALYLVYGPETRGIPPEIMRLGETLHIPMLGTRSLNLATAVAIVLYEAVRQRCGLTTARSL